MSILSLAILSKILPGQQKGKYWQKERPAIFAE